jgi:hypothetical protein
MFTIIGALLTIYGLVSSKAMYERSLGINVNLWWGLVLLAFGAVMLGFAYRAWRRAMLPQPPGQGPRPPAA